MSTMPIGPNDPNFKYLTPIQQRMAMAAQGAPLPTVEDFIRGLGQQGGDPFSQTPQGINALPEQSPVAPPPVDPAMGMPGPVAGPTPEQAGMAPQAGGPPANFAVVDDYIDSGDNARDIYSEQNPAPQKKLGLFGRINQKPGGSRALLALGASLLSAPNFFTGLGQGGLAFQDALDKEAEKLKPKRSFIAGGAFQVVQNADGTTTIERTPVADFESEQNDKKLKTSENIAYGNIKSREKMNTEDNEAAFERAEMEARERAKQALEQRDFERWRVETENANRLEAARITAEGSGKGNKPSSSMFKIKNEIEQNSLFGQQATRRMDTVIKNIDSGKLNLGLISNMVNKAGLAAGFDAFGQNSEYQDFETTLQYIRNAKLRLNTGVQTTFDAQVAMLEIALGKGDERAVKSAFQEITRTFAESDRLNQEQIEEIESTYDFGGGSKTRPSRGGQTSTGVKWRVVD